MSQTCPFLLLVCSSQQQQSLTLLPPGHCWDREEGLPHGPQGWLGLTCRKLPSSLRCGPRTRPDAFGTAAQRAQPGPRLSGRARANRLALSRRFLFLSREPRPATDTKSPQCAWDRSVNKHMSQTSVTLRAELSCWSHSCVSSPVLGGSFLCLWKMRTRTV